MSIRIRSAQPDDAAALTAFFTAIDRETKFLLYEPDERTLGPDEWRARVEAIHREGISEMFVAATESAADPAAEPPAEGEAASALAPGDLAGFLLLRGETLRRLQHSATLVVAVRAAYAGQGIATRLFAAAEAAARARGLHRLQLQVQADNHRAVALYHRWGFIVEGCHRHAVRVDGAWVDDYTMAKLL